MFKPFLRCNVVAVFAASLIHIYAADDYQLGPDSLPQPGVPEGKIIKDNFQSSIFPGTVRDYWVYIPAQYKTNEPACLMVFQDGGGYVGRINGSYRVPVVFDNLIHKKEMPVTIGLFINPGEVPALNEKALRRYNRSFEYDGLGDRYTRFLIEEIIPAASKKYGLNISTNASARAIGGASSGAIAAWTAAWERPQAFSRVFSTIGTYVGLRGGNDYPTLVRKMEQKPIRVFLQDGSNDLNIYGGNWFIANQDKLSALEFSGYEVKHVWGDGGHNGKHGGAIFPDAIRWLWKDYPAAIKKPTSQRHPLAPILVEGEKWQLVSEGHGFTEGPAVNEKGELFFSDISKNTIHKVAADGKVSVFAENTKGANGLMFNRKGELLACQNGSKQIVKYDAEGKEQVVLEAVESNDIAVDVNGNFYFTDPFAKKVWFSDGKGKPRTVDFGINRPNGILFTPDQSLLLVSDTAGQMVFSFQVLPDGSLTNKQPYFHLHMPDASVGSGADGMTVDTEGRLYVATAMGVQVCDQAGRVNGIISRPHTGWLSNAVFGGERFDTLYVTCGDKVFKRKTKAKGVMSWQDPITPPKPRL